MNMSLQEEDNIREIFRNVETDISLDNPYHSLPRFLRRLEPYCNVYGNPRSRNELKQNESGFCWLMFGWHEQSRSRHRSLCDYSDSP